MQNIDITIIQSNLIWENKEANLNNFEAKIKLEKHIGDIVVLPEMFNTGFSMDPVKFAEEPRQDTFLWMKRVSSEVQSSIVGSYMVVEDGKYYNRFIVMHPNGEFQQYDKRHLFRMGNENMHFSAGSNDLIFDLKGYKIKALICYDLRFPVFAKNNYKDGEYDYDVLIYVANWPKVRNKIWQNLTVARALENQCYVIAVNRVGVDGNGLDHAGSSCIISPKGEYIIEPIQDKEFVKTDSISLDELNDFRSKFTVGLDWDSFEVHD
jgi:predicted amidohydrolase